jgi:hypothetical protein
LPNSPFQDEESAYSLAMSMRGDPGSPYAHALRGKRRETPAAEPAYLILALWSRARSLARQAEDLFNGALALQKGMMGELTGESDTHGLENFGVGPTDGPPAMRGVFAAWLKLAGPLLTEDDRLWAPLGPNRELAAMSLASASSVKARLWPENGENG